MIPAGVKVEVSFVANPIGVPTWTDVTAYVEGSIAITRGKADELGGTPPGQCDLALRNDDGRFTPTKLGGPYGGLVRPGNRVRISCLDPTGARVYRYGGHVVGWPVSWPTGDVAVCRSAVTCLDVLDLLGRGELRSVVSEEILVDAPAAYWPLTEPKDSTSAGDISGNLQPALDIAGSEGSLLFGEATGPGTDGSPAPKWTRGTSDGKWLQGTLDQPISVSANGWTIRTTMLGQVRPPGSGYAAPGTAWTVTSSSGQWMALVVLDPSNIYTPDQTLALMWCDGVSAPQMVYVADTGVIADNRTHDIVCSFAPFGGGFWRWTVYVDGSAATWSGSAEPVTDIAQIEIGGFSPRASDWWPQIQVLLGGGSWSGAPPFEGVLSHVAILDSEVSAARVAVWGDAVLTGWSGERPGQRISRYLGWAGAADYGATLADGVLTCAPMDTTGMSPLDAMEAIADSEPGRLYTAGDGSIVFEARMDRLGRRPKLTITDPDQVQGDLEWDQDVSAVINGAVVSRPGGVTVRSVDTASVAAYGPRTESYTCWSTSNADVIQQARWRARRASTPTPRLRRVTLDLLTLPDAVVTSALSLGIGDTIRLTNLPSQSPSATADLTVEGMEEMIGQSEWTLTLLTSPAEYVDALVVNHGTYGQLDAYVIGDY